MKIIGLTGGIGSGKSFVAEIAEKNFPILNINTDEIARTQMLYGGKSYYKVVEEFSGYSDKLLCENGEIDRKVLARIALSDEKLLKKLDEITHPAVIDEILSIISFQKEKNDYCAVLIETALLYEAGIDKICDEVWYVYAPLGTRIKRLKETRGYDEEKIESFFKRQKPEEEFLGKADRTVPNGADVTASDMIKIISGYLSEKFEQSGE